MRKRTPQFLLILLTCLCLTVANNSSAQLAAQFSSNITEGCAPLVVRFKDESVGNPTYWKWDLGNGTISYFQNPAATYFNPGTYTVKLVVSNGSQTDSIVKVKYLTVYAAPVVNFKASDTTGCFPLNVQLTDLTTPGDGSIVSWLWDFGDGSTDSIQNPSHVYTALGNYNVSLQVKNSNGCISTLTRTNYIKLGNGVKPDFSFTAPNNCRPPTPISFTNLSTGTGVLNYEWHFGDGQVSNAVNPIHIYNSQGSYSVKLIIRNNSGCVDSILKSQAITIGSVDAEFTAPLTVCVGEGFQLVNTSQPNPTAAVWTFGDATIMTDLNPFKVYNTAGNYDIKLVSDFGACKDSATKPIQVLAKPTASFNGVNTRACTAPLTTTFSSNVAGAVNYKWFFGDGDSSAVQNPSHTYTANGSYDVMLVVTNAAGCRDTLLRPAFVQILPPQISLTNLPLEGCVPYSYSPTFNIQSVDPIVSYAWDFGDGGTAIGPAPTHIYTTSGTYSVKLVVRTAGGCTDSVTYQNAIRVGVKPVPGLIATPRISCAFQPIRFSDLTTGAVDSWHWYFGDGGESIEQNPLYFYQDTGYFHITLIVANNGCRDSIRINNYIYIKPPIARFIDSSGCADRFTRKFIDRSLGATSWYWNFGDGQNSTSQNPTHTYASAGTFTVTLTVKNDTCEHTTSRQIQIIYEKADFSASDTVICKGSSVSFTTKNINTANISAHQWNFGDGIIQNAGSQVSHVYSVAGDYTVQLIITDVNGCRDTLDKPLYIHVDGPTADFISSVPGSLFEFTRDIQ